MDFGASVGVIDQEKLHLGFTLMLAVIQIFFTQYFS